MELRTGKTGSSTPTRKRSKSGSAWLQTTQHSFPTSTDWPHKLHIVAIQSFVPRASTLRVKTVGRTDAWMLGPSLLVAPVQEAGVTGRDVVLPQGSGWFDWRSLQSVETGWFDAPLDHATFTEHPSPARVAFLRELCIEHGLLSPVHLDIERFESWLAHKSELAHPADGRLVVQYGRWVHLNRMNHLAEIGQLKKGTFLSAKQSTTVALEFLAYLRERHTEPADCCQADIDDWLSGGPTTRSLARGFIHWAMKHGHLAAIKIPYRIAKSTPVITQQQRLTLIRQLLVPAAALRPLEQTAALLLLLYGQPSARIARIASRPDTPGIITSSMTRSGA